MASDAVLEKEPYSTFFLNEQQELYKWWFSLQEWRGRRKEQQRYETSENVRHFPDNYRGQRAELRHCKTLEDVLATEPFHRLCRKLPRLEEEDVLALAIVAGVLAHVTEHEPGSFPGKLGKPLKENGDKPLFSKLRFQQLLASDDYAEFFQCLRRAVRQVRGVANIYQIADGVFRWATDRNDVYAEMPSQRFRYVWSKDYFQYLSTEGE